MADNPHRYGFKFQRSIHGAETPQIFTYPIASAYAPNTTFGGGGTSVNLNIGDPVRFGENGTLVLVEAGAAVADGSDTDKYTYGIVAGFPRVNINGSPRPNAYYPTGTTHGGLGADDCTLCAIIPVAGNIFTVDTDSAGGSSLDTKAEFAAIVGGTGNFQFNVLTAGAGQPKANPTLDISDVTIASTEVNQLRVVGLGPDSQDYSGAYVSLQVVFNLVQALPGTGSELNE